MTSSVSTDMATGFTIVLAYAGTAADVAILTGALGHQNTFAGGPDMSVMTAGPSTVQVNSFHFVTALAGTSQDQASLNGDPINKNKFTDSLATLVAQMVSSEWHEYLFGFAEVDASAGTNYDTAILIGSLTEENIFDGTATNPSMFTEPALSGGLSLGVSATSFRNLTAYAGTQNDSATLIGTIGEANVFRGNSDVPDGVLSNADYSIDAIGFTSIQFNGASSQDKAYLHGDNPTRYPAGGLTNATVGDGNGLITVSDCSNVYFD
jgi:hypothetical protein